MLRLEKRRFVDCILITIVAAALVAISSVGPASGLPFRGRPIRQARLEIRITTTSDWTRVSFAPGRFLAHRVVSVSPQVTIYDDAQGWTLSSSLANGTAVIRAVFEESTAAQTIAIRSEKGSIGSTRLEIINDGNVPFPVADLVNTRADGGTNQMEWSRMRSQLFGTTEPAFQRADRRKLVLAMYYPWYPPGSYDNPMLADRPVDRPSTSRRADVYAMTKQAADNGIDGFIFSWQGATQASYSFGLALEAAEAYGTYVTPYLETIGANPNRDDSQPTDPETVKRWISEALDRAASPAFLRSGGVPVVFVYAMSQLTSAQWGRVLSELAGEGRAVRLVGDRPLRWYGARSWGYHTYINLGTETEVLDRNKIAAADVRLLSDRDLVAPHLYVATVSPGYDDHLARGEGNPIFPRGSDGQFYAQMWGAAMAVDPDWVVITSWNEWYEGTSVQPGELNGDTALRQTKDFSARFKSSPLVRITAAWRWPSR